MNVKADGNKNCTNESLLSKIFKTDQEAHFHNYHNKRNKGSAIQTKLIHFSKIPQNNVSFLWFLSSSYTSGNNLPESTFLLAVATRCNTAVWHRTKHSKYGWVHGQSIRMISELHFKLNYVQHQGCINTVVDCTIDSSLIAHKELKPNH